VNQNVPADYEVTLATLAYGGDALGRLSDGRAVFVPFALPGETVRARAVDEKRGHVRAQLLEVLEPSPERIEPRCGHFRACGGCHYQHLPYEAQVRAKAGILRDQLQRIGKIEAPPVRPAVPCGGQWNYRNYVQFHLTPEGKLGYMGAGSERVVPITECHLPEAALNEIWPDLVFEPGLGLDRVSLRCGTDGETMLVLESDDPDIPEMESEAGLSVVHWFDGDAAVMAGESSLTLSVNGRPFRVSAGSFFQVNSDMAGKIVDHLAAILPVSRETVLLDVYCGVGLFSAFFAGRVGRVMAVESSASSCEDFLVNLGEFDNVELYESPAEEVLPLLTDHPPVAIVDPPRAGLEKRALDALQALGPDRLAYVSCDPSTLARDAARLIGGGYRLVQVTPFDLFPQTYHIESVSLFEKEVA
jgi:23S rRNA (uracil1939-C5)-methyltransferase